MEAMATGAFAQLWQEHQLWPLLVPENLTIVIHILIPVQTTILHFCKADLKDDT